MSYLYIPLPNQPTLNGSISIQKPPGSKAWLLWSSNTQCHPLPLKIQALIRPIKGNGDYTPED